jgi:hypothetical protein
VLSSMPSEIGAGADAESLGPPVAAFGGSGGGSMLRRCALEAVGA